MISCGYCGTPFRPGASMFGDEESVPLCSEACWVAFTTDGGYLADEEEVSA